MHERAHEVRGQQGGVDPPRNRNEHGEQLVRVQHQNRVTHAPLEVMAEERSRSEIALPVEGHVVDGVVEVDEEAAAGDRGREGPGPGRVRRCRAHGGGRNEVSAGTHVVM